MGKRKTSQKHVSFSIDKMDVSTIKAGVRTKKHDPAKKLRDQKFIAQALLECMIDEDAEAFKDIIRAHYEALNTTDALKRAGLSKRTFYDAIAPEGNPSLSTVMKIISGLK